MRSRQQIIDIVTSHHLGLEGDRFCSKIKCKAEEQSAGGGVPIFNTVIKVGLTKKVKS